MGDDQIVISSGLVISPETVASRSFTSAFRGYHPGEVRQFLKRVSDEMAASAGREVELRRALQEALARAAHPELDEATLTNVLGEHAARLLASARETAASMVAEAQREAAEVMRDAEAKVARMREEADGLMARRVAEADGAAASIQHAAEAQAEALRQRAQAEADALVETAKRQGKDMVTEARALRERMLGDLSRRRRSAQLQVEQLRAARDRLLAAHEVVRRTLDEATSELEASEPEARMAAEAAGRRAESEPPALRRPERERERDRPMALVATPAGAALVGERRDPVPASSLFRRMEGGPPRAPERPALRPQTVADSVAARMPPAASAASVAAPADPAAPTPAPAPARAPEPPAPAPAPQPELRPDPEPVSDLATMDVPVVTPEGPPGDVEELFARIRAGRADDEVEDPPPAADVPMAVDPVAGENALAARDDLLDNVEAGLTRALKRVLQDEQNEVLDRLRRVRHPSTADVLPEQAVQLAAYRDAALPWLQQAARAGVGLVSEPAPGSDAETHRARLEGQANELATELVEPLRGRLARALDDGAGDGDASVVAESLRSTYRQVKVSQVEAVARHHVVAAFGVGAYAATPGDVRLQWLVDDDGHCPDCDDNALAGPTAKGEPFPTGQLHPPAHPGCRCLLVPVTARAPEGPTPT